MTFPNGKYKVTIIKNDGTIDAHLIATDIFTATAFVEDYMKAKLEEDGVAIEVHMKPMNKGD